MDHAILTYCKCTSHHRICRYWWMYVQQRYIYTVIRFLWVSSKFGTCTIVSVYGTLVEDKMRRFKGECAYFSFSKCHLYTHDGANANFSTNSHETDNSVCTYQHVGWSLKSRNLLFSDQESTWKSYIQVNILILTQAWTWLKKSPPPPCHFHEGDCRLCSWGHCTL